MSQSFARGFFAVLMTAGLAMAQSAPSAKAGAKGGSTAAADIYKRQCSFCHGADGSGNTAVGKNFKLRALASPEVQQMSEDELFDVINKGKGKMPAFANLGHDTMHGLVLYIREMKKK